MASGQRGRFGARSLLSKVGNIEAGIDQDGKVVQTLSLVQLISVGILHILLYRHYVGDLGIWLHNINWYFIQCVTSKHCHPVVVWSNALKSGITQKNTFFFINHEMQPKQFKGT